MKTIQHLINGHRLRLHLIFSLSVLALLLLGMYFLYASGFRFNNIIWAFTDCLFFLLCIYTGRWLCGNWYLKGGLIPFLLYSLLSVVVLSVLKLLLVRYVFGHPDAGFMEEFRDAMPFFLVGLVMGMLLKLIRASMQKELLDAQIKAAQNEGEFNLLQAQLSPHFLFNVLNNLYGISIEEHQRIPPLLLKLSQLLRYSVYGAKKPFVPLKEEIEYVRNYIEFEQIRTSDRLVLETYIAQAISPSIKIAPLVLIVFIENAFKHAKNSLDQKVHIQVTLKISGNFIYFSVANSYRQEKNTAIMQDEDSGLGLANTLKRLELLYGNDYQLKQHAGDEWYKIELKLKIPNE